jgi:hypothetical protein
MMVAAQSKMDVKEMPVYLPHRGCRYHFRAGNAGEDMP